MLLLKMHKYNKNIELIGALAENESQGAMDRREQLQREQEELEEVLALWN